MDIPTDDKPDRVVAFDEARKRKIEVDLDKPFFQVTRYRSYPDCNHQNRCVTMDVPERKVHCQCGVEIDAFDALLIYANAERRLQDTRYYIEEAARKEAEKKARKPFVKEMGGFAAVYTKDRKRIIGYDCALVCGHRVRWATSKRRRTPPRTMTCDQCYRESQLKEQGIDTIGSQVTAMRSERKT